MLATLLLLDLSSTRRGLREEGRICSLQMLQKLGLHGTLSRSGCADPPCLIDIKRKYSAFVPSAPPLQASLPSFSEIIANRVPGAAQSFTYPYLCEIITSHTHSFAVRLNLGTSRKQHQSV
jgi:hypothetical protein